MRIAAEVAGGTLASADGLGFESYQLLRTEEVVVTLDHRVSEDQDTLILRVRMAILMMSMV